MDKKAGKKPCPYLTSVGPTCFILSRVYCAAGNIKTDGRTFRQQIFMLMLIVDRNHP